MNRRGFIKALAMTPLGLLLKPKAKAVEYVLEAKKPLGKPWLLDPQPLIVLTNEDRQNKTLAEINKRAKQRQPRFTVDTAIPEAESEIDLVRVLAKHRGDKIIFTGNKITFKN